ncbi:nucleotide exchange factor GrpE [Agrilactobacillus yilanensis]|uniref:Protein GrpE n=1 Tax=Agrilactobacillus yilanensis TaxID=2485997 RepID=A0ABW4J910_9LACO|nr:nucleotide exchange factor GrpE [Agrilactobacillus yilanensis]
MAKDQKDDFPSEKDLNPEDTQAQIDKQKNSETDTDPKTDAQTVKDEVLSETKADLDEIIQDDPSQIPELKKEIETLKAKNDALDDQFLRAQAEIRNMSNRFKKEREQLLKYDGQRLAKDILPGLDNLERALTVEVTDESGQQLKKGIEMVHQAMNSALKDNNITEIAALNEKFDPNLHQAVQTIPKQPDQEADTVVQILQRGYMLKDRVLRPAMVIVAQ